MKENYEKDLKKIFEVLSEKKLIKAVDLMGTLVVKLFKRNVVSFATVKKVRRLVKVVEKQENDKETYLRLRRLFGEDYEDKLAQDIGVFYARTLLDDSLIKEKIGNIDMPVLYHYLENRLYEENDYVYHAAIFRMENTAVLSGRTMYMKKDDDSDDRYSLYMEYEYQVSQKEENACIIEHGLTGELFCHENSVYSNFCDDFIGYMKYRPLIGSKEVVRDRKILQIAEDGNIFAFDAEGKLWVREKSGKESLIPEITNESKFEIVDGEKILLHRRDIKEGISESPVLLRLLRDSRGNLELKEYLMSKKYLKFYVWDCLIKRITSVEKDSFLGILTSNATPLVFPEPFDIESVKATLEKLLAYWPSGSNTELDTALVFVDKLCSHELLSADTLANYLYTYIEFIDEMKRISTWEQERIYKRAIDLCEGYIDYQMKLSYILNRCTKKKLWTEPVGTVGYFNITSNGELIKDFVSFSDNIEVEITIDSFKKKSNPLCLPGQLTFDRYKNKYRVKWEAQTALVEKILRKALGTDKEFEFYGSEKEDPHWQMKHDISFYNLIKEKKL